MKQQVVADLDALMVEDVPFKLFGKVFKIQPPTTLNFLAFTNELIEVQNFMEKKSVTPAECIERYVALISAVCPEFDKATIEKMQQPQIAALFQLVLDSVRARSQGEAKKKVIQ